jgi:hypothetical protein
MDREMNATSAAGENTKSDVRPRWRTSPLTRHVTSTSVGSSSVSTHGPSGQKPSEPLARAHCPSFFCQSRAVTSLAQA